MQAFPIFGGRCGLHIIMESDDYLGIDAFTVACAICDKLYDKISKVIRIIPVTQYIVNFNRRDEQDDSIIKTADGQIINADLVIYNEIAPVKYNEHNQLLIYNLIQLAISIEKPFIMTSNNARKEIIANMGNVVAKFVLAHTIPLVL